MWPVWDAAAFPKGAGNVCSWEPHALLFNLLPPGTLKCFGQSFSPRRASLSYPAGCRPRWMTFLVPSGTWTTRIWGDCSTCRRCAVWVRHLWADVESWGCRLIGHSLEVRFLWTQSAGWRDPSNPSRQPGLESGPLANAAGTGLQAKPGCKAFLLAADSAGPSHSAKLKGPLCSRLPSDLGGEGPCLLVPVLPLCPG